MCSMISAQGVVVATAMAVSGTVILLALRLQKSFPPPEFSVHEIHPSPPPVLRSCISNGGKKSKKKKKKKVQFAEDVVESCKDGEEFRKRISLWKVQKSYKKAKEEEEAKIKERMPANRVALYNGILRDRVAQRLAYSC